MITLLAAAMLAATLATGAPSSKSAEPWPEAPVPDYGIADGECRKNERGPAIVATAVGLKDRSGTLRLELYSAVDGEWLDDDRELVRDGKVFRRAVMPVPATGPVELCVRAPHAGQWALALVHDRAGSKKFKLSTDGIGFSANPHLGFAKPRAQSAAIAAGAGLTRIAVRLNYRKGLLSFGPLDDGKR